MPLTRSSCFYVSSLFFLVAVTGICIFASAYDVIFQILHPANKGDVPNYQNLAVFGGSYVLLGLLATIFGFSRYVTVKLARQAIPKAYMPISQEDLPKKVYEFVQSELDRVARLAKKATPTLEESAQPGWGKPESSLQDTHFKTFMASTPHFIERAAIAYSPDLARPLNMSISAYLHMLMDQRLVARDIALEYIAGYEQARFGGAKNDFSPVTLPGLHHHNHNHHHHPRSTLSQQRHPHDASIISTSASSNPGNGGMTPHRAPGEELVEEDYIRFMKVLSLILQGLGWDQNAEDAYEEEIREQEREQQEREREYHEQEMFEREEEGQPRHQHQQQQSSSSRYFERRKREPTIGSSNIDRESSFNQSRQDLLQGGLTRSLSGESYCIVDEAELRSLYPYPEGTASMSGTPGVAGSFARSSQTAKRMSRGGVGGGHSTRMSTRSLMTMRTVSSTKS
ncbi:MAG: hypothetical protein BYD32DRAFT_37573 [Podila humilis]|nr:MAG: hypothetical protein BYD32DRAFT_37573 [Podila humilis]